MSKTASYQRWSAEEINTLHRLYAGKVSVSEISEILGRTMDSVYEKAGREGLRKHSKRHQRDLDGPWRCPKCARVRPKECFGNSTSGRGSVYCKECTNKSQKVRRQRNNR